VPYGILPLGNSDSGTHGTWGKNIEQRLTLIWCSPKLLCTGAFLRRYVLTELPPRTLVFRILPNRPPSITGCPPILRVCGRGPPATLPLPRSVCCWQRLYPLLVCWRTSLLRRSFFVKSDSAGFVLPSASRSSRLNPTSDTRKVLFYPVVARKFRRVYRRCCPA
jgi:hypothetical protein